MKAEYDLSKMKSRPNRYAPKLKKSVTMRLSEEVFEYFKSMVFERPSIPQGSQKVAGASQPQSGADHRN